jgi:3-oxoadipate enol-lactonase
MNLAEAERIAAAIPDSELQIMEMTGHGSPFFRPTLVVELIRSFADRVNVS